MDSLTKENFWNEMHRTFPVQMKQFLDWIDQYKLRKQWRDIFSLDVKFHHLPLEMQTGVIFLFFREIFGVVSMVVDVTDNVEVAQYIKDIFAQKFMENTYNEWEKEQRQQWEKEHSNKT